MNCYLHTELPATAYCRSCGKPLCDACQHLAHGTIYCLEHAPVPVVDPQNPYAQPTAAPMPPPTPPPIQPPVTPVAPPAHTSPALAFILGFIPGVGAIYNGQYLKGLVHAIIFGLLVSIMNSVEHSPGAPAIGCILAAFMFYMPFEAYHTSKRRLTGQPVEEFSSIIPQNRFYSRTPIGPVLLILFGVLFLLDTMNLIEFRELVRFWPVLLIVAGAFMLYNRVNHADPSLINPSMVNPSMVDPSATQYGEPRQ